MHFWTSRRTSVGLIQLAQKCFCQQIFFSSQNCIKIQKYNSLFFAKHNCLIRISEGNRPRTQILHLLRNMSSEMNYSTSNEKKEPETSKTDTPELSMKDKLKRAVKDYGATVMVFHISMSLASLGLSYLVISSGVDVASLLEKVGFSSSTQLTAGASTFVVAYALHKVFAPVRISITLGCTPFIVRYLRRVGVLKPPKSSNT